MSDEEKNLPMPAGHAEDVQARFENIRCSLVTLGYPRAALDLVTLEATYHSNEAEWRAFNDGEPYTTYTVSGPSAMNIDYSRPFAERSAKDQAAGIAFQIGVNSFINIEDHIHDGRHAPDDGIYMQTGSTMVKMMEVYKVSTRRPPSEFMPALGKALSFALLYMKQEDEKDFGAPKKNNAAPGQKP